MVRAVKNEFNFQSLNPWRTAAKAFAIAFPALFLNAAQHGWQGMAVMGAVGTMIAGGMLRSFDQLYEEDEKRMGFAPRSSDLPTREEDIAARVSQHFGLPPVRVVAGAPETSPFQVVNQAIQIHPGTTPHFSDEALEWVMAHELDHIRNLRDLNLRIPVFSCGLVSIAGGLVMTGAALFNGDASATRDMTMNFMTCLVSYSFFRAANTGITREVELRCDANALRATGNLDAAKEALYTFRDLFDTLNKDKGPLDSLVNRIAYKPHPSLDARLKNLDRTWEAMQIEGQARHAPAP